MIPHHASLGVWRVKLAVRSVREGDDVLSLHCQATVMGILYVEERRCSTFL